MFVNIFLKDLLTRYVFNAFNIVSFLVSLINNTFNNFSISPLADRHPQYELRRLNTNTSYVIRVAAKNAAGYSDFSQVCVDGIGSIYRIKQI